MTPNASAVPTACAGGTCRNRIRTGAVMMPAPTPVIPMATAMTKPRTISMALFARDVDTALEFATAPAPGTEVLGIGWRRGARGATDAGVSVIVQRKQRNAALF